ncbi:hypothetical protein ACFL2Q_13575 [Thermodesulfobacteriota bacterium]
MKQVSVDLFLSRFNRGVAVLRALSGNPSTCLPWMLKGYSLRDYWEEVTGLSADSISVFVGPGSCRSITDATIFEKWSI